MGWKWRWEEGRQQEVEEVKDERREVDEGDMGGCGQQFVVERDWPHKWEREEDDQGGALGGEEGEAPVIERHHSAHH